jgi:transposase InsO family protein
MSPKASPWRNGFQESFYAGFKADLKDIRRFNQLGELIEAIAHTIHYYNSPEFDSIYIKEGFGVGISGFAAM